MEQKNIKTPNVFKISLVLLIAVMLSFHLISGLYARYSSTATGSVSARVAKIDIEMSGTSIDYSFDENNTFDANTGAVYATVVEFSVTNRGEVTYEYQLDLRLSDGTSYETATQDAYITLASPRNLTIIECLEGNNVRTRKNASELTNSISKFAAGNAYFAVSTDKSSYTWAPATVKNDGTAVCESKLLAVGETHYYKVIYFIQMKPETSFKKMQLFYSATCQQID